MCARKGPRALEAEPLAQDSPCHLSFASFLPFPRCRNHRQEAPPIQAAHTPELTTCPEAKASAPPAGEEAAHLCPQPSLSSSRQSLSDPLFVTLCLQGPCSPHLFLHPVPCQTEAHADPLPWLGGGLGEPLTAATKWARSLAMHRNPSSRTGAWKQGELPVFLFYHLRKSQF